MGNDWGDDELERGGRPRWLVILHIIFIIAVLIFSLVRCAPSTTEIPRSTVPSHSTVSPVLPTVQTVGVPTPRPERNTHKPSPASTTIYVVSHANSLWHVKEALSGWKLAKYTDFKQVETCPVAAPCVTIRINKALPIDTAALTTFTTSPYVIYMDLNPAVTSPREAENTVSHELGHVLGAPHIIGTLDTVMAPIGVYRVLPTRFDIRTVDALGRWDSEKMYQNSGKTLDMRSAPN